MESVDVRHQSDGDLSALQADLRNLITSLQDHRINVNSQMSELGRKLENITQQQQRSLEEMEEKLMRLFVLRAEYDPKHQVLLDKIAEYDKIIAESRNRMEEYTNLKISVKEHDTKIDKLESRTSVVAARILPWIALLISLASVYLNYAQHVVIR